MGAVRSCDARCHKAKAAQCVCWCGGVFHGAAGENARQAFKDEYFKLPSTEGEFDTMTQGALFEDGKGGRWRLAVAAAVKARAAMVS